MSTATDDNQVESEPKATEELQEEAPSEKPALKVLGL